MNWQSYWSSVLGSIPGLVTSLVLLWLGYRNTKAIEAQKSELATGLAKLQHELANRNSRAVLWHEKRIDALVEIYDAFRLYIDFLRLSLYVNDKKGRNMDPAHDFRRCLDKNLLYLDDNLQQFVQRLSGELLDFWIWAVRLDRPQGITDDPVQHRLDYEIPEVLERLRKRFNEFADPAYLEKVKPDGSIKQAC